MTAEEYDIFDGMNLTRTCLDDKAFVRLVDTMPRIVPIGQTGDQAIVQAGRTSLGLGIKTPKEDRGMIRFLARHQHTTPFEMVEWKFHCKMPILTARQWIRHRTANVNEISGRYAVLKDEFYTPPPDELRRQSKSNKQGSEGKIEYTDAEDFAQVIKDHCRLSYDRYTKALADGVTREQARMILPVNIYTEWYWKIDLHNLFHFLGLRCDSHAQYEIRVFADAMLDLIQPIVPWAVEAFNDYHHLRGAVKLSRLEVEAIKKMFIGQGVGRIDTDNGREQEEWIAKAKKLGLIAA